MYIFFSHCVASWRRVLYQRGLPRLVLNYACMAQLATTEALGPYLEQHSQIT